MVSINKFTTFIRVKINSGALKKLFYHSFKIREDYGDIEFMFDGE